MQQWAMHWFLNSCLNRDKYRPKCWELVGMIEEACMVWRNQFIEVLAFHPSKCSILVLYRFIKIICQVLYSTHCLRNGWCNLTPTPFSCRSTRVTWLEAHENTLSPKCNLWANWVYKPDESGVSLRLLCKQDWFQRKCSHR